MRIKKCCFCLSLHTGCLIIAALSLVSALATSFGMGDQIFGGSQQVNAENNEIAHQSNILMKFFVCVISVLFCILLVYGTIQKRRKMVLTWVILMACQCVLVFVVVVRLIHAVRHIKGEAKSIVGGILGVATIQFVLSFYCWLVVYSRYLEIRDEDRAAANIASPEGSKLNDPVASSNC